MLHAFLPPTGRFAYLTNIKLIFSSSFMLTSHKQVFAFFFFFAVGICNNLHRSFALKFFKIRKHLFVSCTLLAV